MMVRVYDGFIKIDIEEHNVYGARVSREIARQKPTVCGLVYAEAPHLVWLVRQYRAPVQMYTDELVCGYINPDENPMQAMIRELREETGVISASIAQVGGFYSSLGWTDEYNNLFICYIDASPDFTIRHGVKEEGEDITLVSMDADEFVSMAFRGELKCAKSMIAGLWLGRALSAGRQG
jgi:ADP-ribose pyrophosphatase